MNENIIKLNNDNILRFTIEDENGNDTGNYLEFDLEDIELPLRYQELVEKDKKNKQWLDNQLLIIEKREDVKGKKLLTKNQEDKLKAINEYLKKEEEVYDMFLGEGGVKKLLNVRKLRWTTFNQIDEIISNCIIPKLNINLDNMTNKIKSKYKIDEKE
ncbi:MAG: hypothetical protein K6E94_03870, partial [Elusimicrobiaceae bacterium]|nr:hypothetical protein [Elusimicrobiaceae bacterium]